MRGELAAALRARGFTDEQLRLVDEALADARRHRPALPCYRIPYYVRILYGIPPGDADLEEEDE